MTRKEQIDWLCRLRSDINYMDFSIDVINSLERKRQYKTVLSETIEALEQEPIDYKTQHENYLKKSEVVISQLRADRDRLQDAFDKVKAEIKQYQSDYDVHGTEYDRTAWKAFNRCLKVIDKYKAESEE